MFIAKPLLVYRVFPLAYEAGSEALATFALYEAVLRVTLEWETTLDAVSSRTQSRLNLASVARRLVDALSQASPERALHGRKKRDLRWEEGEECMRVAHAVAFDNKTKSEMSASISCRLLERVARCAAAAWRGCFVKRSQKASWDTARRGRTDLTREEKEGT